jgi:aconitate hydratase
VAAKDFNSYGSRRGNHEVMVRGTFANIRLRNQLVSQAGGWTRNQITGETVTIFDAAQYYADANIPLLVIAGKEYGTGSSRDWAAKGTALLGVKAVLAQSFERIHRSNLAGMGVLPLQFIDGHGASELGLDGSEEFTVTGITAMRQPGSEVVVTARRNDGWESVFPALVRLDTPDELECWRQGGILPQVWRALVAD